MRSILKSVVLVAAAAHLAVAPLAYAGHSYAATNVKLPSPYVSRAFDAVLIPIDDTVRGAFKLDAADTGVLVLSVEPGGVADKQGVQPGDVISQVKGHKVTKPIDLDEVVYYWLQKGVFDFGYDYYRAGKRQHGTSNITLDLYNTVIDIATIATWTAVSYESFSYSEFYAEYSEEITTSYESSETTIVEETSSEAFSSEVTEESATEDTSTEETTTEQPAAEEPAATEDAAPAEEAAPAEDAAPADAADDGVESAAEAETNDTDGDGIMDAEDTDDDGDGVSDADDTDDDGDGVDDAEDPDAGGDDE